MTNCMSVTMLSKSYPSKDEDAHIEVFVTNKPTSEYVEIAIIKHDSEWSDKSTLNNIKSKARELGADAVIITERAGSSGGMTFVSTEKSGFVAVAIKYKD